MGRLWLRWLGLAVVVVAFALAFVNLGLWQLDRLDQRRERNGQVVAHENTPVQDWAEVFTRPIVEGDQWQRVRVSGTFDGDHQFIVRYRSNAGETGYEVVTPLRTATGTVLVDRGFAARPGGQDFPKVAPAPPAGPVTVIGYVRRNERGSTEAVRPVDGQLRLISAPAIGETLPYPVVDGYISALEVTPAQAGGLVPVQPPALTEGNHFSYALQWFAFAALAGVALVVFVRADLRDKRTAEARRQTADG